MQEAPYRTSEPLVAALVDAIAPELDVPFAFFGHSLGTIIAFEAARELRRRGFRPRQLVVAARIAPQVPLTRSPLHGLSDPDFLKAFQARFQAIPPELLREPELLAMILTTLRADFEVHETYACRPEAPLDLPVTAFGGCGDQLVSRDGLAAWREQTTSTFALHMLPGGHFFHNEDERAFLRLLWTELGV